MVFLISFVVTRLLFAELFHFLLSSHVISGKLLTSTSPTDSSPTGSVDTKLKRHPQLLCCLEGRHEPAAASSAAAC